MAKIENQYRICIVCENLRYFEYNSKTGHGNCKVCGSQFGNIKLTHNKCKEIIKALEKGGIDNE